MESDIENGIVEFNELRYGTYYIKEITAPQNYMLSDEIIKVEINDEGIFINGEKYEETEETVTIEFENEFVDTPKTGDEGNAKMFIAIILLSLAGLTVVARKTYKMQKENKKLNK